MQQNLFPDKIQQNLVVDKMQRNHVPDKMQQNHVLEKDATKSYSEKMQRNLVLDEMQHFVLNKIQQTIFQSLLLSFAYFWGPKSYLTVVSTAVLRILGWMMMLVWRSGSGWYKWSAAFLLPAAAEAPATVSSNLSF